MEATLFWLLPVMLRPLPFALRVRVGGRIIGPILLLIPKTRKRLSDNLDLKYPDISPTEKRRFMGRITRNTGRRFIEIFYNGAFHKRLAEMHLEDGALDQIAKARKNGRPVILVSGHFGQWEAPRAILKSAGFEAGAIYKKNNNPIFERHHYAEIAKGGEPLLQTGPAGARAMVKHLKSGGIFAILLDQANLKGALLDFFGLPAYTSLGAAELALKYNALLVPCYGIFRRDGRNIDVIFEPAIPHSDPVSMTQALNDSLAARIKTNPEQWYWLHRRWKMPQSGTPSG